MSESPAPHSLELLGGIVRKLFPWVAHVILDDAGDLVIKAASTMIHLAGGAGDPAVARVGDTGAIRFYRDTIAGALYVSTSTEPPYVWTMVASGIIPPTPADAGTLASPPIVTGSGKVTCA